MIFVGLEKIGFVLLFCTPDEFYVRFVINNESIKLLSVNKTDERPTKNEVLAHSKFVIEYNSEYILCQIKEDLKYDEIFCQVSLCNTDIVLKVDYRKLIYINPEDIINDKSSISLKLHDFSPCLSNQWNSNLILKLQKLMNYKKLIFQFKSIMVDPSDGRYPVEVLNLNDRQSLNEKLISDNLAMKSSEYFKAKLENTINEVFNGKKNKDLLFQVSVPLAKINPKPRADIASAKVLNASAQIFIPSKVNELKQPIKEKNLPPLNFNIVHMFSEMYRNRQSKMPFRNYESVFPLYGGVSFSNKLQSETKIQNLKNSLVNIDLSDSLPKSPFVAKANSDTIETSLNHSLGNLSIKTPDSKIDNSQISNNVAVTTTERAPITCLPTSVYNYRTDSSEMGNVGIPLNLTSTSADIKTQPTLLGSPASNPDSLLQSFSNLYIQPPFSTTSQSKIYTSPVNYDSHASPYHVPPGNFVFSPGVPNYAWRKPVFPDIEYMRRNPAPEYYIIKGPTSNYPIGSDYFFPINLSIPPPPESIVLSNSNNNNNNNLSKPNNGIGIKSEEATSLKIEKPGYESCWTQSPPQFMQGAQSQSGRLHVIYYSPN